MNLLIRSLIKIASELDSLNIAARNCERRHTTAGDNAWVCRRAGDFRVEVVQV